jgi:hypothetical protein
MVYSLWHEYWRENADNTDEIEITYGFGGKACDSNNQRGVRIFKGFETYSLEIYSPGKDSGGQSRKGLEDIRFRIESVLRNKVGIRKNLMNNTPKSFFSHN